MFNFIFISFVISFKNVTDRMKSNRSSYLIENEQFHRWWRQLSWEPVCNYFLRWNPSCVLFFVFVFSEFRTNSPFFHTALAACLHTTLVNECEKQNKTKQKIEIVARKILFFISLLRSRTHLYDSSPAQSQLRLTCISNSMARKMREESEIKKKNFVSKSYISQTKKYLGR